MIRRTALPVVLGIALSVAMTWPLVLHLGSQTQYVDAWGDPLYLSWQVAWIGHAILHDPLSILQSNMYLPLKDNLTFTDVLFGYAPAGLVAAHGPHAALVVHNLLFLFTFVLAFVGAFLLARELGAGEWGAAAAGAAFAWAPWKLAQAGHLHVLSSGGIPLALYLLVRGYRRGRGRLIVGGWLVAAWQMTLGFNLGLQFAYLLLVLVAVTVALWLSRGRRRPSREVLRSSVAGVAVLVVVTALVAVPFVRVQHDYPEATMPSAEVAFFSPPLRGFLAAPKWSLVWGGVTESRRSTLNSSVEQTLFPGVTVLLLALLGLFSGSYPRSLRVGLAAGTLVCFALSLGTGHGFDPYSLLRDYAPGWTGVRTPGRINNLTSLGLGLLAGAGLTLVIRKAGRAGPGVAAALVAAVLVEGLGPMPHARVPARPASAFAVPAPQLHLPTIVGLDGIYAFWSVGAFPKLANAASSFDPAIVAEIRTVSQRFPDRASVGLFRRLGIRSVVLHRGLARGTPWAGVPARSIAGLGITRRDEGGIVVYALGR